MVIYKTTNLVNGKIYVGKDKNNKKSYLGSGVNLKDDIKKYGRENFKKEILEVCDTEPQMNEREKYWIKELKAKKEFGNYNVLDGGSGGSVKGLYTHASVNRDVSGENNPFFGKTHSEETRQIMSEAKKGKPSNRKGKTHSEESRKKMSEAKKGKPSNKKGTTYSEEIKQRMSEARKGKPWTEERRLAQNDVSGTNNPMYGKNHSEETKQKIRDTKAWTRFKKSLAVVNQSLIDNPHTNN